MSSRRNKRGRSRNGRIAELVHTPLNEAIISATGDRPDEERFERAVESLEALMPQLTESGRDDILAATLMLQVERLFESGWQPVELTHCVAHRMGSGARLLVRTAIATYGYAVDTDHRAPGEWLAQLSDLEIICAPEPPELRDWYTVEGLSGSDIWRHALRLTGFLFSVAPLPSHNPPPRYWDSAVDPEPDIVPPASLTEVRQILQRAESAPTTAEAFTHTSEAVNLIARNGFDAALMDVNAATLLVWQVRSRRVLLTDPDIDAKTGLLQVVCENNGVRAMSVLNFGISVVVGRPADIDMSLLLYESLIAQARNTSLREHALSNTTTADAIRHFARVVIDGFADANDAVERAAYDEHGSYGLVVLARREAAADITFDSMFPDAMFRLNNDVA